MHSECIIHESLLEVYKRLGTDKPHVSARPEVMLDKAVGEGSPIKTRVAESAQNSIDKKFDGEKASETMVVRTKDNVGQGAPTPAPLADAGDKNGTDTPNTATKATPRRKSEANGQGTRGMPSKPNGRPYEGLFEASLHLGVSPLMLEVTDLRANIYGEGKWQERIKCLVCGTQIS